MRTRLLHVELCYEHDVVLSRQRARQVAALVGFSAQDQVRIATSVSEIARNTFRYAGRGKVEFFLQTEPRPILQMIFSDHGQGIPNLSTILAGKYVSRSGMGLGIVGTKKLMDKFEIETGPKGTTVSMGKYIGSELNEFNKEFFSYLTDELSLQTSQEPFVELQQQNQELLGAFSELEKRQNELTHLNVELQETKRQLNLQNELLESRVSERTAELKDSLQEMEKFCYSIAHDLKAPLRAINGLTMVLQQEYAPAFDAEGKNCTNRIVEAATRMHILIVDLLDYGRLTHMDVAVTPISLNDTIAKAAEGLREVIVLTKATIEVQKEMPIVMANSVLLDQVLSNLIENALKFVPAGVAPFVKIWAEERTVKSEDGTIRPSVRLSIKDNGIGVDVSYHKRIFKVFERLHGERSVYPGTGIGLALVQKAVERMNGISGVESTLGQGSLFWIELPKH
ncbi:MAG: signal transduction histidine kinase [Verrucomicrobiales bacterium]|nr:signal transduction histidine kinase [Verrucomicrobiales bacterium]